jgi:hypothetical protein
MKFLIFVILVALVLAAILFLSYSVGKYRPGKLKAPPSLPKKFNKD